MIIKGTKNIDWFSQIVPECFFELKIEKNFIHLEGGAKTKPYLFENLQPGFHEKLWQRTVIELFIGNDNYYNEFNFAPNNTWWHCTFSEPRKPLESKEFGIELSSEIIDNYWKIKTIIPFNTENLTKFNITWIVNQPLQYISFTDLPKDNLNFHQPDFFTTL